MIAAEHQAGRGCTTEIPSNHDDDDESNDDEIMRTVEYWTAYMHIYIYTTKNKIGETMAMMRMAAMALILILSEPFHQK